jgi:hypothetical protein
MVSPFCFNDDPVRIIEDTHLDVCLYATLRITAEPIRVPLARQSPVLPTDGAKWRVCRQAQGGVSRAQAIVHRNSPSAGAALRGASDGLRLHTWTSEVEQNTCRPPASEVRSFETRWLGRIWRRRAGTVRNCTRRVELLLTLPDNHDGRRGCRAAVEDGGTDAYYGSGSLLGFAQGLV